MTCQRHPHNAWWISGMCSRCLSERKAQERKLFKSIPDRLLADVVVTPVQQAEEILYGKREAE